jgi:Zn-dependent M28 family amino/carboxypeptidase
MSNRFAAVTLVLMGLILLEARAEDRATLDRRTRGPLSHLAIEKVATHVQVLGSDLLGGRAPGSTGGEIAARYLAERLGEYGLLPPAPDSSYYQQVPLHGSTPTSQCHMKVSAPDTTADLALGDDYLLYATGAQTLIPQPVPLIFAGYGIIAPEFDYNDYQSIDVNGAIAVFLSGEPQSTDPHTFDGPRPTVHALPGAKQRLALALGARGSILIPSPAEERRTSWARRRRDFAFEHVTLAYGVSDNLAVLMNPSQAHLLFRHAAAGFLDVVAMDSTGAMQSFPLATSLTFHGSFRERDFQASNVAGLVPGNDPLLADSYLLISAHYDHLGVGIPVDGDSIYNGVIDNATGVAAALEMARVFSLPENRPNRSLVFLFPTAEESGLLGSRFYCDHPLVPLHRTIASINVDGLAFLDTFDDVVGVGGEYSTLGNVLGQVASALRLEVSPIPFDISTREEFSHSDNYAFARAGIPSILIQEGLRFRHIPQEEAIRRLAEWGREVYHSPFDDLTQPISLAAANQHLRVITAMAATLASGYQDPQWVPGHPFALARLQSIAEQR